MLIQCREYPIKIKEVNKVLLICCSSSIKLGNAAHTVPLYMHAHGVKKGVNLSIRDIQEL